MSIDPKYNQRWPEGIPHHPMSLKLMKHMAAVDFENGDSLDLSYGGDGDNGETMMFLMDSFFEQHDAEESAEDDGPGDVLPELSPGQEAELVEHAKDGMKGALVILQNAMMDKLVPGPYPAPLPGCAECEEGKKYEIFPDHRGSRYCRSGSLASGGDRAHCTCDTCF